MRRNRNSIILIAASVIVIAAAVFAVTGVYSGKGEAAKLQDSTPKQSEVQPQQQEAIPEDLKGFAEYSVKKELGSQTSNYKDRIRSIAVKAANSKSDVMIELNGNNGFTKEMTVRGMLMDSKRLFKRLSDREDINKITVIEYLEVEDIDGSPIDEWAFTLVIEKNKLDKFINENMPLDELTKLADEYKLHPNLE